MRSNCQKRIKKTDKKQHRKTWTSNPPGLLLTEKKKCPWNTDNGVCTIDFSQGNDSEACGIEGANSYTMTSIIF